jgi:hypothetical protein
MPVIVVGPDFATGVRWALRHPSAALTITENEEAKFIQVFSKLRDNIVLRRTLSSGALAAGTEDFDPGVIRAAFLQQISEVSQPEKN